MQRALLDQNQWWTSSGFRPGSSGFLVERSCFSTIWDYFSALEEKRAVLLLGPRQVGKTTLALQLIDRALDEGVPPQNVVFVDFQHPAMRRAGMAAVIAQVQSQFHPDFAPLFVFDEVQFLKDWPAELKTLVDRGAGKFFLTGSASRALLEGHEESLQGRDDRFFLHGFSFREFLRYRALHRGRDCSFEPMLLREELAAFFDRGSFPAHAMETDLSRVWRRIRNDITAKAIAHDIVARLHIRNDLQLQELFLLLVERPGQILNVRKLCDRLEINPGSANLWLRLLVDASLLGILPASTEKAGPSRGRGRQPKVYPTEPGLASAYGVREDRGPLVECILYRHLIETVDHLEHRCARAPFLGYWNEPGGAEVDFLLRVEDRTILIEATSSASVSSKKLKQFQRLCRRLEPDRAILACMETTARTVGEVEVLPLERVLLECDVEGGLLGLGERP